MEKTNTTSFPLFKPPFVLNLWVVFLWTLAMMAPQSSWASGKKALIISVKKGFEDALPIFTEMGPARQKIQKQLGPYFQTFPDGTMDWQRVFNRLDQEMIRGGITHPFDETFTQAVSTFDKLIRKADEINKAGFGHPIDYILKERPQALALDKARFEGALQPNLSDKSWALIALRSIDLLDEKVAPHVMGYETVADVIGHSFIQDHLSLYYVVSYLPPHVSPEVMKRVLHPNLQNVQSWLDMGAGMGEDVFPIFVRTLYQGMVKGDWETYDLAVDTLRNVLERAEEFDVLPELLAQLDGLSQAEIEPVVHILKDLGFK